MWFVEEIGNGAKGEVAQKQMACHRLWNIFDQQFPAPDIIWVGLLHFRETFLENVRERQSLS